ncbi:MAG: M48 family metallopeptidase [Bacteroidota bacterium]|jgi:predicted Zn-dependent protease
MKQTYTVLLQGLLLLIAVLLLFVLLMGTDWAGLTNAEERSEQTAQRVGELMYDFINETEEVATDSALTNPIHQLIQKLCRDNGIDYSSVTFHVLLNDEVNAFALPGRQLVVYTGLLDECRNESELAGVLAHELAHIEQDHVMKKLAKELGFSMLSTLTNDGETLGLVFETLGSSAYDRELEIAADMAAVEYLEVAGLNPRAFADILYRIDGMQDSSPEFLDWISTHPDAQSRAEAVMDAVDSELPIPEPVLPSAMWDDMKAAL